PAASAGAPQRPEAPTIAPRAPVFESEGAPAAAAPSPQPPPASLELPAPVPAASVSSVEPAIPAQPPPPSPLPPPSLSTAPLATDFPEVAGGTDRDSIAAAALAALERRFLRGAV